MSNLQNQSNAVTDSQLINRFAAHLLQISDDILGEATNTNYYYFRQLVMKKVRQDSFIRNQLAQLFLSRALSQSSLTLPIVVTDGEQTTPSDAEISNACNGFFGDAQFLVDSFAEACEI